MFITVTLLLLLAQSAAALVGSSCNRCPWSSHNGRRPLSLGHHRRRAFTLTELSALSSRSKDMAADDLFSLLTQDRDRHGGNVVDKTKLQALVEQLVDAKVTFDPTLCLDGPLFVSTVVDGPEPLWEKLGTFLPIRNIQGQQYQYDEENMSVINYAEVLGSAFHLRAYGTYESQEQETSPPTPPSTFDFPSILSSLKMPSQQQRPSAAAKTLQCPADFTVSVNKASIYAWGNPLVNIPISGTGYLRVLYADPRLRIFVSALCSGGAGPHMLRAEGRMESPPIVAVSISDLASYFMLAPLRHNNK